MGQHKGEIAGWYVNKELPGRYSNPKNILKEYFFGLLYRGMSNRNKKSSRFSLIFLKCFSYRRVFFTGIDLAKNTLK
jgi:hypothetical protein